MLKKINSKTLCTVATIIYHCTFLGGAGFYVAEFQKTRDVIVAQVDRVEKEGTKLRQTGDDIKGSIRSVEKKLEEVGSVCKKLRF